MKGMLLAIVMFSLFINFSVAIMIDVVPAFNGMDERIGLSEADRAEYIDDTILDEFGNPVNGYPTAEDSTNINSDTLMDRIGLGSISNLLAFINKYMFGFLEVLKAIFGPWVNSYVFDAMKYVIGLLYIFTAIELFTGKRLKE